MGGILTKFEVWYVSTHIYVVLENIPFSTKVFLISLISAFLCKNSGFFGKISPFLSKQLCESYFRNYLVLFLVFVRQRGAINENLSFKECASEIPLPSCSKLAKNWNNDNGVKILPHDVIIKYFWRCLVSLVSFSYWFKFDVNSITGSLIMTIFLYKGLTRNPIIRSFAQYLETGASYGYQTWHEYL